MLYAQSDIEWKFGLSKLIRNMHRTTTAPSPLNLVTTWFMWIVQKLKARMKKKKRPSLVQMMGIRQASPRTKAGAKWLSKIKKDSVALSVVHLSPLGSQTSFAAANQNRIENICDWEVIARKYRTLVGDEEGGLKDEEELEISEGGGQYNSADVNSTTNVSNIENVKKTHQNV